MADRKDSDKARRGYWTEQMEAAHGFMEAMREYPVEEEGESLVALREAVSHEGVAVEFSATKLAVNHDRLFYLREGLVDDFIAASREMNDKGWVLKVEDGFRSRAMQKDLALQETVFDVVLKRVMWETGDRMPDPELTFRRLTVLVATCPKIGTHMSGSAIDVSVLRADDSSEIDRGGPYLELSELTPMASPFASAEAQDNRGEISEILQRHGFRAYPYEFWHYSKGDAFAEYLSDSGRPGRYGPVDFDIATGKVTAILNPKEALHDMDDIAKLMDSTRQGIINLSK